MRRPTLNAMVWLAKILPPKSSPQVLVVVEIPVIFWRGSMAQPLEPSLLPVIKTTLRGDARHSMAAAKRLNLMAGGVK